jgi:hypothetical protein
MGRLCRPPVKGGASAASGGFAFSCRPPVKGGASEASGGFAFSCRPPVKGGASEASGGLSIFQRPVDLPAHAFEGFHHFSVSKPDHPNAECVKRGCSFYVVGLRALDEMTVAVELHDQPVTRAIEVRHILAERFLTRELLRTTAQELVPKLALRRGGLSTKRSCSRNQASPIRNGPRHPTETHDSRVACTNATRRSQSSRLPSQAVAKNQPPARFARSPLNRGAEKNR